MRYSRTAFSNQAHDLEGWAAAFCPHDPNTVYSGADDGMLKRWDLRAAGKRVQCRVLHRASCVCTHRACMDGVHSIASTTPLVA